MQISSVTNQALNTVLLQVSVGETALLQVRLELPLKLFVFFFQLCNLIFETLEVLLFSFSAALGRLCVVAASSGAVVGLDLEGELIAAARDRIGALRL